MLIAVLIMTAAGCDFAKVGAKCKPSAPLPRDATHVLYCKNGKWARLVTVEQATQFIIGTLPGTATVQNPTPITPVVGGGTFTLEVKVLRRNGNVSPDTNVDVTGPGSGPSVIGTSSAKTDANGIARIPLTANDALGTYDLTIKVNGAPDAKASVTNVPVLTTDNDRNARPIKVGQLKSIFFTVSNAKGTPIPGVKVDYDNIGAIVVPSSVTDANGQASADFRVSGTTGPKVFNAHAAGATVEAHLNVTSGDASGIEVGGSVTIAVSRGGIGFIPPIKVVDSSGNGISTAVVTYTVIPNGPVSGTISSTLQTGDNGSTTANAFSNTGVAGTFQIRASLAGNVIFQTFTINVV